MTFKLTVYADGKRRPIGIWHELNDFLDVYTSCRSLFVVLSICNHSTKLIIITQKAILQLNIYYLFNNVNRLPSVATRFDSFTHHRSISPYARTAKKSKNKNKKSIYKQMKRIIKKNMITDELRQKIMLWVREREIVCVCVFFFWFYFSVLFSSPAFRFTCGQRTIISIMHARKTANSTNRISDPMAIASLTLFLWSTSAVWLMCVLLIPRSLSSFCALSVGVWFRLIFLWFLLRLEFAQDRSMQSVVQLSES